MAYNIKDIRSDFKKKGIFYTDPELAECMKSFIDLENISEVYDPTCGDGGLLSIFGDDVEKFGQEINAEQLAVAEERLKNFHGVCGDTLVEPAFMERKFKLIMANPPFSIAWEPSESADIRFMGVPAMPPKSKADFAFLIHILWMLDDNGEAIVLNFPGVTYRGNSEGKIRQWMVQMNYIDKVIYIEGGKFVDTKISTVIFVLKKNRKNDSVQFIEECTGRNVTIGRENIAKYGYSLSQYNYLPDIEEEKEPIDLAENTRLIRECAYKRLEGEIKLQELLIKMGEFGPEDLNKFLNEIITMVESHKKIII